MRLGETLHGFFAFEVGGRLPTLTNGSVLSHYERTFQFLSLIIEKYNINDSFGSAKEF
jgi:hypothetical protein